MALSPPAVDRVTLRFRDPSWETSFWGDTAAERARQARRNVWPLVFVIFPGFLLFYATRTSWPDDARLGASAAMAAAMIGCVAFAAWSRTHHFLRHTNLAYGTFMLFQAAAISAPIAMSPPSFAAAYGLALTVMLMLRWMQVSTFPVMGLTAIGGAWIAVYLAVVPASAGFDAATTAGHALMLIAAFAVGLPRMRDNHLVVRREYAFRRISDMLVEATLPRPIADRLKRGERTIADRHPAISVLFADLVGFTRLTQRLDPAELAMLLDTIFTRFDELASAEGVEKIKTIGDSYMAAAGLPEACPDHAVRAARMALGMRDIVAEVSRESGHDLQVRIGLDTGPAVAGVLGRNKLLYDVWGDVVNTASRMESHGEPGAIQISERFRRELGDGVRMRDRGTIDVKGKGPMRTWFLDGFNQGPGRG